MRAAILLAALAACGKGKSECVTESRALVKLLTEANTERPHFFSEIKTVARPELGTPKIANDALYLEVRPGEVRYRWQQITLQELDKVLMLDTPVKKEHRIYLVIDPATPWSEVVAVVDVARVTGFTTPSFVFHTDVTLTPPPRSSVDDQLDQIMKADASEKATQVAQLASKTVESCPALKKAFNAVSSAEGGDRASLIIEGIGEALPDCGCSVDMGALRSIMWRIIANPRPERIIAIDVGNDSETKIALAAATPWSEANKKLTATTTSATFAVAP